MARLLLMVRKDLLRIVRRPLSVLIMLAFPLVFALMLAITFGGGAPSFPKIKLLIEDRDENLVGGFLISALTSEQAAEYFAVEQVGEEGMSRMEEGEASALLRIPENFTNDLLEGNVTALELVRNPAEQILPEVAEQLALSLAELLSAGSRVMREPLDELAGMLESEKITITDSSVAGLAVATHKIVSGSSDYLFPPAITLEAIDLEDPEQQSTGGPSIFLFVLPGVSVFALFMLGDQRMSDLLTEDEDGTLRRQLSAPLGAGTVVLGKALQAAVVAVIALVILSAVGLLVVEEGIDLAAFALLSLSLISLVTGAATLIYGAARTRNQGATIGTVVYLFFAFVGGSFIQTSGLPAPVQRVAPYTPFYWATEGYRLLLHEGEGLVDILPYAALLAGTGTVCLLLGSRLLHRKLLRGSA